MRMPSYRKHASGQARVTLNGKDYHLGSYGSSQSKEAYGRLIAEYTASGASHSFGTPQNELKIEDVLLAYIRHARVYYNEGSEFRNMKTVVQALRDVYATHPACKFGAGELGERLGNRSRGAQDSLSRQESRDLCRPQNARGLEALFNAGRGHTLLFAPGIGEGAPRRNARIKSHATGCIALI